MEHFIMDLGTANNTKRRAHILRPHTYYELTNGIELTIGDIHCQYFCNDKDAPDTVDSDKTATPSPKSRDELATPPKSRDNSATPSPIRVMTSYDDNVQLYSPTLLSPIEQSKVIY